MLELRKITRGYQITLPRSFRDKHHLEVGDVIELLEEDGNILIKPLRRENRQNTARRLITLLEQQGDGFPMTEEDLLSMIKEERKRMKDVKNESRH